MNRIEMQNVTKTFGDVVAVDHVTLSLESGKIYGLLGRNGAGKTTLLNIITNRLFATSGRVLINGKPAQENDKAQADVYMTGELLLHPPQMRVSDVFKWAEVFYEGAFDHAYATELCEAFGLNPKKKIRQLSTGYKSIYKIITALSLKVSYLLLDEPVLGLDANHRDLLYRVILENYAKLPRAIIISTHLIEEVAGLIEEVIIIKEGRVIRQAPCEELLSMGYTVSGPANILNAFIEGKQIIGEDTLGGLKTAYILGEANRESVPEQLEISRMDLQRLFIQLTNK